MNNTSALDSVLPKDLRDAEIFVINDIALKIAPSQISVQQENLVYQYKVLRSRTSTKIPTGHGNILLHLTIPFLSSELLQLHRLIVEYRHSPFCYIENRYVREVCTPHDWPDGKSMAFAISSLNVAPLGGSSDAWVAELDLIWFNYEPFGFNWLYREDWLTVPLQLEAPGPGHESGYGQYSIGWQLDRVSGDRIPSPIIVTRSYVSPDIVGNQGFNFDGHVSAPTSERWSILQERLNDNKKRTIYDMQAAHFGDEFDLLPLPGNMAPANWVINPKDSRVYVRYINLLQRDALYKNFGIDVEEDLKNYYFNNEQASYDPFFRAALDIETRQYRVWSLASDLIPDVLKLRWLEQMLETQGRVSFLYCQYTEAELPVEIRDIFDAKSQVELKNTAARQTYITNLRKSPTGNQPGDSDLALPFTGERRRLNSGFGPRVPPKPGASSYHKGLDFRGATGAGQYAPVDCVVAWVDNVDNSGAGKNVILRGVNGEEWHFYHMSYIGVKREQVLKTGEYFGNTGNTGIGTGSHIHMGYKAPGSKEFIDPSNRLKELLNTPAARWWETVDQSPVERAEAQLKADTEKEFEVDGNQVEALLSFYEGMADNGWLPYLDDINVTNVWYRPIMLSVENSGAGGFQGSPNTLYDDGCVLTGVSGTLTSVLARLPILDHEYPTLQHLGSTEPKYMMEFTSIDNRYDLEGISDSAKQLVGMRAQLQSNARRFRPVVDGWCVATDTFITRLLGTFNASFGAFEGGDLYLIGDDSNITDYALMRRRTTCSYQSAGTVEGNPGLSSIQMEFQETNPYEISNLVPQSAARSDVDADYAKILKALYNLEVADKYRGAIRKSFVNDLFAETSSETQSAAFNLLFGGGTEDFASHVYRGEEEGYILKLGDERRSIFDALFKDGLVVKETDPEIERIYISRSQLLDPLEGSYEEQPSGSSVSIDELRPVQYNLLAEININPDDPEMKGIDSAKLLELYRSLHTAVLHGSLQLEEQDTGGLDATVVEDLCYGLPVQQWMFQGWQEFLQEHARQQGPLGFDVGAATLLTKHAGWKTDWRKPISSQATSFIRSNVNASAWSLYGSIDKSTVAFNLATAAGAGLTFHSTVMKVVGAYSSSSSLSALGAVGTGTAVGFEATSIWSALFGDTQATGLNTLVDWYLGSFPLDIYFRELTTDFARGALENLTVKTATSGDALSQPTIKNDLFIHAAPTGLVSSWRVSGRPVIVDSTVFAQYETSDPFFYGPVKAEEHTAKEEIKLRRIREALVQIAKTVLNDPGLMRVLGLENLMHGERWLLPAGLECYPDMILPPHPYYGDSYAVSPDFYLWNMYEDGGAFRDEQRAAIQEQVDAVVTRAHTTFSNLRTKTVDSKESQESVQSAAQTVGLTRPPGIPASSFAPVYNAEASDAQADGTGAGTPFYQPNKLVNLDSIVAEATVADKDRILSTKPKDYLVNPPRMSSTEGHTYADGTLSWGQGQYASRLTQADYARLYSEYESTTDMFGSRQGHSNEYLDEENAADVVERSKATSSEQLTPLEYTHAYTADALKKIARDSSHDMVSMKRSMRRAYPTFKFYIVEEDEQEDRYVAMDDFSAYNGVKEFTVVRNRKSPADHAILSLQNIDGTLDGSRRSSIIDVDYFANPGASEYEQASQQKLESQGYDTLEAREMGRNTEANEGTADQQPYSSVVLRPGMNTQLRVGYSNDPRNLEVLISGRIVDLQWNKTGDLAEVLIQSFGTELVQQPKGMADLYDGRVFFTTHELLGSLMLEPEVTHFGRWEFGAMTQVGESKSNAFDFYDYGREGYMGRVNWMHSWGSYISNNPLAFAAGTAATVLIARKLPKGILQKLSKGITQGGPLIGRLPLVGARAAAINMKSAATLARQTDNLGAAAGALALARNGGTITQVLSRAFPAGGWGTFDYAARTLLTTAITTSGAALAADAVFDLVDKGFYLATGNKIRLFKKWFDAKKATVFLSPQDDNIFPPHPKDYMLLNDTAWKASKQAIGDALESLSSATLLSQSQAQDFRAVSWDTWVQPERLFTKKVDAQSCQYVLDASTIWDVFEEMTLRHPGWVFGARPYGDRYEYRMYFGPPNQRYWSKPATNEFIDRMNRLSKWIQSDGINDQEFTALYGEEAGAALAEQVWSNQDRIWKQEREFSMAAGDTHVVPQKPTASQLEEIVRKEKTAISIREYLKGLNLRFTPFRRHHLITSDRDIIYNGIMGTTNASYNAVDVRYYQDVRMDDMNNNQAKTTLVKAHTFIPDNQLRIHPITYSNCRGYPMAVRYGVGQLLYDLREMYRGEILVVGSPRFRPWDICIMIDQYNDMVGPIEIEQVVDTFSYETGYVTEIKPSMVVMANEISTWPVLEGLKIFGMAVHDIENKYRGHGIADTGFFGAAADLVNPQWSDISLSRGSFGHGYQKHIESQYAKKFGDAGAEIKDFGIAYGLDPAQNVFGRLYSGATDAAGAINTGAVVLGTGWGLTNIAKKLVGKTPTSLSPRALIGAGVAVLAAGYAEYTLYNWTRFPNVIWLMGGANIFLQCLHNETIIAMPLMKNGTPIVAGLTVSDPEAMYKAFAGGLNRWVEDSIEGTIDLSRLYARYASSAWELASKDPAEVFGGEPIGTFVPGPNVQ